MTCKPVKASVWPPKHPDATLDYAVDFEEECARLWSRLTDFSAGERIRIFDGGKAVGFEFEPTTPGRSGVRRPLFPSVVGDTVPDGSVVWTCRAISAASLLRTVSGTPVWEITDDDGDVTISSETVSGFKAIAHLAGGEDDEDYVFTVSATTTPDGLVIPKTVILPVRVPANPETVC
jgi:hypothetical protein